MFFLWEKVKSSLVLVFVVVVVVFVGGVLDNNFTFAGFIFFVLSLSLSLFLSLLRDTSHPQYEQYEYE